MPRLWLPDKPSKQDWAVPRMLREKEVEALTKNVRIYRLTSIGKIVLEAKGYVLRCRRCGRKLQAGEEIVSRMGSGSGSRYYDKKCWESLFF